ncbi:DUF3828 domain-containing protein [Pseudoluteimonas lycopersici]|nr:DUF3828 domain-containing protein [Lysobacter lycopersici]
MKTMHPSALVLLAAIVPAARAAEVSARQRECQAAVPLLQSVYHRIESGGDYDSAGLLRQNASKSLIRALDAERASTPADEVGAIDFDVFTDAQDIRIDRVHVEVADSPGGASCTLLATMLNYGEPIRIRFSMLREDEAWKIDDIAAPGAANQPSWRLRELLALPADAGATP